MNIFPPRCANYPCTEKEVPVLDDKNTRNTTNTKNTRQTDETRDCGGKDKDSTKDGKDCR